jgi:predicted lipoprotein
LFDERTSSACPATDDIVKSGAWQKLVAGDLAKRRAEYAASVAEGLHQTANQLVSAWQAFAPELSKAGAGSKLFANTSDAVNAVTNAMFYLDTETKDMKIANPAGLSMACMAKPCPEKVEHPYAKVSKESVIANIEGFRDLFRGLPPAGADKTEMWGVRDLLHGVSQSALANEMDGLLDNALAAANGIDITLEAALLAKDKRVPALYAKIQDLTARLKSDFIVQLHLSAPMNAAGDND